MKFTVICRFWSECWWVNKFCIMHSHLDECRIGWGGGRDCWQVCCVCSLGNCRISRLLCPAVGLSTEWWILMLSNKCLTLNLSSTLCSQNDQPKKNQYTHTSNSLEISLKLDKRTVKVHISYIKHFSFIPGGLAISILEAGRFGLYPEG